MATVNMWRAALLGRMGRPTASVPMIKASLNLLTAAKGNMTRMERVNASISFLNSRDFVAKCLRDEQLAMQMSVLLSYSVDGPSASLFRDAHSQTIRDIVKSFCGEAETRVVHIAWAISAVSRINTTITDQLESFTIRLLRQMEMDAESFNYTEREIVIIAHALSRFATQCFAEFAKDFKELPLYRRVLKQFMLRYGTRDVAKELCAASFILLPADERVSLAIAARKFNIRARSLLLGCFAKAFTQRVAPTSEQLDELVRMAPHICQPEIISVSHSHLSNSFAHSLGLYITALQAVGDIEGSEKVLHLARMLWEHVPPSRNIKDRSYATRLSLLAGVPWLKPSTEELRRAIAPLRHSYAFNILPALRGLRVVSILDNAPREELMDIIEHIIVENLHIINLTDVRYVLRQLADPRIPVSSKAVDRIVAYVQGTSNFDADDLSMMARLVSFHAPPEYHQGLLKEVARQFVNSVPNSSVCGLSLITLYDVITRNNLESKAFFEKAIQYNKLATERLQQGEATRFGTRTADLNNFLHFVPAILKHLKPFASRSREVKEFILSLIDLGTHLILAEEFINPQTARKVLYFAGWIAIIGTPGKNTNAVMRPALQHLMKRHVVTGTSLSGFTRSVSLLYRNCTTSHEAKRLFPVLNLYCTAMLRNQFLIQPVTASFAVALIIRRGSVTVEPVNRSHQETVRVCANIMTLPQNKSQLIDILQNGTTGWLADLIGSSFLLDSEARLALLEGVAEVGIDKAFDSRANTALIWGISKGDFLYLS